MNERVNCFYLLWYWTPIILFSCSSLVHTNFQFILVRNSMLLVYNNSFSNLLLLKSFMYNMNKKGNLFWFTLALIPCYSILVFINRSIHNSSLVHTTLLSNAFFLLLNVIEKQDNWEHISKTWGSGNLISHFVNSIVSPVCLSLSPSLFCCYLLVPQVSVFVLCVSIKNLKNLNSNAFYQLLLLLIFFSFFFLFLVMFYLSPSLLHLRRPRK